MQTKGVAGYPWILTHTGKRFRFYDIKPSSIDIEDIAHALSNLCRFTGHTNRFYSVAEHCVNVYSALRDDHPLVRWDNRPTTKGDLKWALLHDASEAYLNDLSRPLKRLLLDYGNLEDDIMGVVATKFALPPFHMTKVRTADIAMSLIEAVQLLGVTSFSDWDIPEVMKQRDYSKAPELACWTPQEAKTWFLGFFNLLFTQENEDEQDLR